MCAAARTWMTSLVRNPHALRGRYPAEVQRILNLDSHRAARSVIERFPGYARTALNELPRTARQLGLDRLWLKDESTRFGLGAFKSVGGAYAVYQLLSEHIHKVRPEARVSPESLTSGAHRDLTSEIVIACASAGNHGRA